MTAKSKRHQAKPQARQPIRRHKGRTREGGNRIATKASDSEFAAIKPERKQAKTNEWQPSRLHKRGSQLEANANKNDKVAPLLVGFHRAPTRQKIERQPQTCANSIGTGRTLALPRALFFDWKKQRGNASVHSFYSDLALTLALPRCLWKRTRQPQTYTKSLKNKAQNARATRA